jgi:excisionase family DNA binding protein
MDGKYLTPKDAADILKVNRRTIYSWLKSGKLSGSRLSPRITRIPQSEIDRVLADGTNLAVAHTQEPNGWVPEKVE